MPLGVPTCNLPVTFAVVTYAGSLAITMVSDQDVCPDIRMLRAWLIEELRTFPSLPPPVRNHRTFATQAPFRRR